MALQQRVISMTSEDLIEHPPAASGEDGRLLKVKIVCVKGAGGKGGTLSRYGEMSR